MAVNRVQILFGCDLIFLMKLPQGREKINEVILLMSFDSTSFAKVEKVLSLMHGVDPRLDMKLDTVSRALFALKNIQEGDVVELVAENLPEGSESEKKKKKALLFFIKSWRELREEVERVKVELDSVKNQSLDQQAASFAKIATFAKGPFGIVTVVAIILVGGFALVRGKTSQSQLPSTQPAAAVSTPTPTVSPTLTKSPSSKAKTKVITFNGKKIPLDQLEVRTGPDCTNSPTEAAHYHAANGQYVIATDGTKINDPGACAFGKVDETQIEEIIAEENASEAGFDQTAF